MADSELNLGQDVEDLDIERNRVTGGFNGGAPLTVDLPIPWKGEQFGVFPQIICGAIIYFVASIPKSAFIRDGYPDRWR